MIDNINSKYCPFCGINIETDSQFCQNCGASLKQESIESTPNVRIISERPLYEYPEIDTKPLGNQYPIASPGFVRKTHNNQYPVHNRSISTTHPNYPRKKTNDTQGVVSLIFAILSFVGVLPIIGSIIAIILGGKKAGTLGIIGRILGWLSLIIYIVFSVLMFL